MFDVFVCHASEDKNRFVRPLAEQLKKNHIEVWYDEFTLKAGDGLRKSIDIGLSKSRYGIVVLSKNFFKKEWPQWELDGLVQRQLNEKTNLIIPIWHNISKKEVIAFSPSLADKVAIESIKGLDYVVSQLLKIVKPDGSTLLIARDILLEYGYDPPAITDDWWLDVIEFSASNPVEGTFQEASGWGRWGFPLPPKSKKPSGKGKRLAKSAMQMLWENKANLLKITQITHPDDVLEFINSTSGLGEICHEYIPFLACYAPQLTIRGFGGEFEHEFERWYKHSLSKNGKACAEIIPLRHPTFGNYKASNIACNFILGDDPAGTRPETRFYEIIDYIVWFLSDRSFWLPKNIHKFLLQGFKEWAVWLWTERIYFNYDFGFKPNPYSGVLSKTLYRAKSIDTFKLTRKCLEDIETRFDYVVNLLKLDESAHILAQRFLKEGFIEEWFMIHKKQMKSKNTKQRK